MKPTILVADDEPSIVLSLQVLLQKAGFEVRVARNGEEAIASVEAGVPDLILLDAMMPRRDGFDVCQSLRANPACRDLPIIMLTARSRDVERQKGMALGATDYITKPFSTRDLVATVRRHLGIAADSVAGAAP
ncbi:response regulator transcription factor [Azospirillum thermophilum]|uniref:Two-component system response regulator n=1 Tax=Azospirillum thermophilum TaxID=2202148 RepID=A0A2S2CPK9_9PROT|nr:response regulator [Azospirillum thermophilum]AWK86389.1 two-component system response regulator [Azospirillum thermophilum]